MKSERVHNTEEIDDYKRKLELAQIQIKNANKIAEMAKDELEELKQGNNSSQAN